MNMFEKLLAERKAAAALAKAVSDTVPNQPTEPPVVEAPAPAPKSNPFLARLAAAKKPTTPTSVAEFEAAAPVESKAEPKAAPNAFLAKLAARKAAQATTSIPSKPLLDSKESPAETAAKLSATAKAAGVQTPLSDSFNGIPRIYVKGNPLNDKQMLAVVYAKHGLSFVLTGPAGTGKTTAQAGVVQSLDEAGKFKTHNFKYIGDAPSIAIVAFTKVAVRNIQKAMKANPATEKFASHCMTIHSLLEFEPVIETRKDEDGLSYDVRIFRPMRNASAPLRITHLVVEEASMVGLDLWQLLLDALPDGVQIILLGDINQLQPVFGSPILGYGLAKLPVIELTEVYRQALDNPIIANAHRVLKGLPIQSSDDGRVAVLSGKQKVKVGQAHTAMALVDNFRKLFEAGVYDPDQDMILSPWNVKPLGVHNMNAGIATFLGEARGAVVHEVRAGMHRWFLAVGDRVMSDKRFGTIVGLERNVKYAGPDTAVGGSYHRLGVPIVSGQASAFEETEYANFSLDNIQAANESDDETSASRASSHLVIIQWDDLKGDDGSYPAGAEGVLRCQGDFSPSVFQFGYVMTVHKAQGSEFRHVFFIGHYDHMSSCSREMIYTALTRARERFMAFCKEDFLARCCSRSEIKGDTLEAKIAYFTEKLETVEVSIHPEGDEHVAPMLKQIQATLAA